MFNFLYFIMFMSLILSVIPIAGKLAFWIEDQNHFVFDKYILALFVLFGVAALLRNQYEFVRHKPVETIITSDAIGVKTKWYRDGDRLVNLNSFGELSPEHKIGIKIMYHPWFGESESHIEVYKETK